MKSLRRGKADCYPEPYFLEFLKDADTNSSSTSLKLKIVIKLSGFKSLFFMFVWLVFKATRQIVQCFLRQNCSSFQCQEASLSIWHSTTGIQSWTLVQIINKCSALFSRCTNFSLIRQAQLSSAKQSTLQTKRKHSGY